MDVKINAVQGATGVAGVVQVNTCEAGVKKVSECSVEGSANGAIAGNLIGKTGAVAMGDIDVSLTTTKTDVCSLFVTKTQQYTVQNVASMNQQVIASATNAGMQGSFNAAGSQTFVQAVTSAPLPNGGYVNSSYVGAQSYNIVGK